MKERHQKKKKTEGKEDRRNEKTERKTKYV